MDKDKLKQLMLLDNDFLDFWDHYPVNELRFPNRKLATFSQWQNRSHAARKSILKTVMEQGAPSWKNPYFYVQDFPEPVPQFLRGDEHDQDIVQVRYNDLYQLCSRTTMELFGLEYVCDWNS